jgi:DNA-directed RNA polymerase specialized sigma24 family protein
MTNVQDYRNRASECERLGRELQDPAAREQYRELAAAWRDLADILEHLPPPDRSALN